jgi:hypothetical protein
MQIRTRSFCCCFLSWGRLRDSNYMRKQLFVSLKKFVVSSCVSSFLFLYCISPSRSSSRQ